MTKFTIGVQAEKNGKKIVVYGETLKELSEKLRQEAEFSEMFDDVENFISEGLFFRRTKEKPKKEEPKKQEIPFDDEIPW